MGFSKAELARRTDEARPIIERLSKAGCRFAQLEMPDNNGNLRGKLVRLTQGLLEVGTAIGTNVLSFKGGGNITLATPFSGGAESGFPKIAAVPGAGGGAVSPCSNESVVHIPADAVVAGADCQTGLQKPATNSAKGGGLTTEYG